VKHLTLIKVTVPTEIFYIILIVKVAQKQTKQLRASSYTGTDDEWQAILRWLLLHETPTTTCSMPLDQVELVVHSIETEKEINVIVRQNIKGITVWHSSRSNLPCFELSYDY